MAASQGTGREVSTRLYLEGRLVEDAFVSVMVAGNVGAPQTAQIEIVPTKSAKHIMPLTSVQVYTTDPLDLSPNGDLSDFKLLFAGVVVARGFTKTDKGRNVVLQCAGPEIFWVNARQFWLNIATSNGSIVDQLAVQTSGGYGRFGKVSSTGTYGYMVSKLAFQDEGGEERFMDTMVSVIDDIGAVNPFYTNARNRFRITDRIIRAPAGKTEKLFQLALMSDFIDGLAGRQSGQTNLSQVVNQLLSAINHEWVSIPAPPYVRAQIFDRDIFGNIKRVKKTLKNRGPRERDKVEIYDFKPAEDNIVASILFKPHIYTLPPPSCNVLFPNMYDQLSYNESFMSETTRMQMKPQLPFVSGRVLQGLFLLRPTELEVFTGIVRDSDKRSPDAKYAGGNAQTPTFNDYDWTTNEERIRGIVYNFGNLAPAASSLTLSDPGKKHPSGTRKGGIPKYLQNVASYEWYKSKFNARQASIAGLYNMRAVPGFPMLALDDSDAEMNIVAYLNTIQHHISADGTATTSYGVSLPRVVGEVDYNRPRFSNEVGTQGELRYELLRDEDGQYSFEQMFDGDHEPPIPEWFDETFRNQLDLDIKYAEWFGENVGVVQKVLFGDPGKTPSEAAIEAAEGSFGSTSGGLETKTFSSVGEFVETYDEHREEVEKILEQNENVSLYDAVKELARRFQLARDTGREFEVSSSFTDRAFTKIDEYFRFVGAAPLEMADRVKTNEEARKGARFTESPADSRTIDYKRQRLDFFVGDTSPGSGYSAKPLGGDEDPPEGEQISAGGRMSGAFPEFDVTLHTGEEATDQEARDAVLEEQATPSDRARYDGRPIMFDFEFRLWLESLKDAGYAPSGSKLEEAAAAADYFVTEGGGIRPATPEERAASAEERREARSRRQKDERARSQQGKKDPSKRANHPPDKQAPTGDEVESDEKLPLPQPLSEKQVVDLRRAVVDAYREELARNRGHSG